jgi:S1-C subfamily serine protease
MPGTAAGGEPALPKSAAGATFASGKLDQAGARIAAPADLLGVDGATPALPPQGSAKALAGIKAEDGVALRGTEAVQLYRRASPAVVLIVTEKSLGSGTLLNTDGDILTNWHVVGNASRVGVIFKPVDEGRQLSKADLRPAQVVRVDEVADLALVRVSAVPAGVTPISLGQASDIEVGADVHAIGHPQGEDWTYTKGVISQIRQGYDWTASAHRHRATVIQTQTPINPGNSGGPLLSDSATLLGVNAFKAEGEGLNFAVGLDDVQRFLSSSTSRFAEQRRASSQNAVAACEPKILYSGFDKKGGYEVTGVDSDCDGRADVEFRLPAQKGKPLLAVFDSNGDGQLDVIVFSFKRNWKWDMSFVDTDFDGNWDLVGYHDTGQLKATRYEPYSSWERRNASR